MKDRLIYHTISDLFRKEKRNKFFKVLAVIILLLVLLSLYSSLFYYKHCQDESCFLTYLSNCDRATYSKTGDFSLEYKITGYAFRQCNVDVALAAEQPDLKDIYQNSKMVCKVKLGSVNYPESSLSQCTGILKEGFQEVIIDRLKVEVVRNIGDINLDILKGA